MNISLIIDIVFIALIVILAIIGLVKGFAKSLISMIGLFAALIISILVAKPFANLINSIFGADKFFGGMIENAFIGFNKTGFGAIHAGGLSPAAAEAAAKGLKGGGVFDIIYKYVFSSGVAEGGSLAGTIGQVLGGLAVIVMAAILAFILIKIILAIVQHFIKKLTEFSIIGGVDKVLGFVFGAAKGVFFVGIAFVLTSSLTLMIPSLDEKITPVMDDTVVAQKFYYWVDDTTQTWIGNQLQQLADNILNNDKGQKNAVQQDSSYLTTSRVNNLKQVYVANGKIYFKTSKGNFDVNNLSATSDYYISYSNDAQFNIILTKVYARSSSLTVKYSQSVANRYTHMIIDENTVYLFRGEPANWTDPELAKTEADVMLVISNSTNKTAFITSMGAIITP